MTTTQKNTYETAGSSDESFVTTAKRSLAQREDIAGQAYRAVRDNPKTSAAIATGVAAAAAGAGAFLWNKNRQQREAVENEVTRNNDEELSNIKGKSASSREPQA